MTEAELITLFRDLHSSGLANEPKDKNGLVFSWMAFFGNDDARIITKACQIHVKRAHFWPAPGDIEKLKTRASWLLDMETEEFELKKQLSLILGELHNKQLIGEPEDLEQEIEEWYSWFNAYSVAKIREAIQIYLSLSKIWPTPMQILYLIPSKSNNRLLVGGSTTGTQLIPQVTPPRALSVDVKEQAESFCKLCGLCEFRDQDKCPLDF